MYILINSRVIFRTAVRLSPSFIIPIIGNRNDYDINLLEKSENEIPKKGFDRVKNMFIRNEYGEISHELNNVLQMSFCGAFFGACMGGFAKSKDAYVNFIENNQATIFKSTMDAKKKLQDQVTVAFARGAYHWGWRLGIFSGIFGLITTAISVYRDDSSIVEYVTAGAVTGAIYKANLGVAAMIVGAGLGAVLSLLGGLCIVSILKVTGRNMDDIRRSLYTIRKVREQQFHEAEDKASNEKHDTLTLHHDLLVQEKGAKRVEDMA